MTRSLKLSALAAILGAALAAPAWSQPSTSAAPAATLPSSNSVMSGTTSTSSDPYDPSNTQLREQCLDTTTNTWKTTAQCEVFIRNGIAPPVVGGGSATATNRSATGTTSSLNPSMSSSGTAGTGTSGSTSGATSGSTTGSTGTSGATSGATSGGTSGGSGH